MLKYISKHHLGFITPRQSFPCSTPLGLTQDAIGDMSEQEDGTGPAKKVKDERQDVRLGFNS
jgi:hypothetical protein